MGLNNELLKALKSADLLSDQRGHLGYVSTGSYAFNRALSGKYNGGASIGGFLEIWGESSTGKTIFLSHIFREAQKQGYYTGIADNEFSYDIDYARTMGVDPDQLLYFPGETIPECFRWMETVIKEIREKDPDTPIVLGVDSMAGQSDVEASRESVSEQTNMDGATRAKEVGALLRRFNPLLYKNKVLVVLINQVRSKVGVLHGDPTTKSGGGKSLEFYCAASMKVLSNKSTDVLRDENKQPYGIQGKLRNTKNKTSIPFQEAAFSLTFQNGLDPYEGLAVWLARDGIIEKNGGWYTHLPSGVKWQGAISPEIFDKVPALKEFLEDKNN